MWTENSIIASKACREAVVGDHPIIVINAPINVTFQIIDTKLYVPVVTLSTEGDNNFLEQLKTKFKGTINK